MIDDDKKKNQDQNQNDDDQKGGEATFDPDLGDLNDDSGEMDDTDRP